MQKSQRAGKNDQRKKYSKMNKKSNEKEQKRGANFSALTHLKALVGWVVGWCDKVGWGREFTVKSQKPGPIFSSQFALSYKVQCRKRPNQRQNGQLLLSGFLKRELPW